MNCTHCGKKLYPEAPFCPHCGKPNEQRVSLENNVRAFDQSYDRTMGEVKTAVRRKNRVFGKIAAIIFLICVFAATVFMKENYVSSIAYDLRQKETKENLDTYLAEINGLLDAQDYFGVYAWLTHYDYLYTLSGSAEEYRPVIAAVRNYCDTVTRFMNYAHELENEKFYHDTLASRAKSIRGSMSYYYKEVADDLKKTANPARTDAIDQMSRNLEALAVAYFDMPPAEAASLSTLTEGAREVLLEQVIQAPEEPEEPEEP
ncbi:MAG: zinc ribbon domain-containing protein [Lachnospiraceae bacterium]|nr:zinc ribbon domain-containing protein [Lachnospiraceae bacterium]